ncbi:class I SAM-dependent methyltransferase [Aeropyrum camini]|uniref:class I SAM-dependent methyltransferase n=1 Tax=Aeropyrum camini TaxID=229980 RepID=UPI0011E59615|nr:class I SAM-dependent methyltransferase family protein [Aeropyrum camini]
MEGEALALLKHIAEEVLGRDKAVLLWKRIDVIGDIAVIKKPMHGEVSIEDLRLVAGELLKRLPHVRSVWLALGPVGGVYKVRQNLVHLAGERRTSTVYREHGAVFLVDISKVFITPRLSYEHLRVARLVKPGETVVNMFAGVGIFSIIIALKSRPSKVYSIDINPEAHRLMVENIRLNRVERVVEPLLGDSARVVSESLRGVADRILMPLPDLALDYIKYALEALGGRGWLHVYLHVDYEKGKGHLRRACELVKSRVEERGWRLIKSNARVVRSVGPKLLQVVVDAEVERYG